MNFDFLKVKSDSLKSNVKTKFYSTFFATVIAVTFNLARDSNGILYMICKYFFGNFNTDGLLLTPLKNLAIIFIKCADVSLCVFIIFFCLDTFLNVVINRIYSKNFKKRREYLRELLCNNIIPCIHEINKKENDFLVNVPLSESDKNKWIMDLADFTTLHKDIIRAIRKELIFEEIGNNGTFSKPYCDYLKDINFLSVYVIFYQEQRQLSRLCEVLGHPGYLGELNYLIYEQYESISNKYDEIIHVMNTNKKIIEEKMHKDFI